RLLAGRGLAAHPRRDQRGLEATEELGVVRELVVELRLRAAVAREFTRDPLEEAGPSLDEQVALRQHLARRHRFAGGSSPVASRQTPVAARRATSAAAAANPAYVADHSSLRSTARKLTPLGWGETSSG